MRWCWRRSASAVGLAAAVVILAGAAACSGSRPASTPIRAVVVVPGKLTAQQADVLRRSITAPTVASEAAVVAAEIRAQFVKNGRTLLPAGSSLRIETGSFRETNAGTATVSAVVSGPAPGRWQLLLAREGGQWLVIGTRRL